MSEPPSPSQTDGVSAIKKAMVSGEINEDTLNNVAMPEMSKMLLERIVPDFGILDKLLGSKALSRAEKEEVTKLSTSQDKNSKLIELVTKNDKLKELFNALKNTHQEHLVNYVTAKGVYSEDYGGTWPLTERETSILDVNQESLVDNLDFSGNEIIHELCKVGILNGRQKEFICKKTYDYEKAEVLLDFLYRSSLSNYWRMTSCLHDTNQKRVAKILLEGGALVRVHNTVDGEAEAALEVENEIVARIESLLNNIDLEPSRVRVLERLQVKLIAARIGHSVNLYMLCESLDELVHLDNLLTSGELQKCIEMFFNQLASRSERVHVITTISEDALAKCRRFLEVDRSQEKVSGRDILKICEQMKVEEHCRTEEEEEEEDEGLDVIDGDFGEIHRPEEVEAEKEQSVEAAESHSVPEEMLEDIDATQAYALAEDEKRGPMRSAEPMTAFEVMAAILRNNTDYFLEYMRPRGLIDRLHGRECLTDEETRYIKTLREDCDKNDEILKVIRGLGLDGYSVLVDLLRTLDQGLVAEVAEKGGVVLKATITSEEGSNLERVEKKLVERLNLLLNKTSSRSKQLVQFLSLLGRGNIQILNARWEHDIIVWFWCRSEGALTAIDSMNETDEEELTLLMTELFKVLLGGEERVPEIINVDLEDPDKMMVVRTSSICPDEDRELSLPKCSVCSAAILGSNIYILLQNPSCLLVFDKSKPNKPTNEIPLAVIADPVDMVSSQQSSCLYITDRGNSTVWKCMPTDKNVVSWLQNIGSPYTLSANSNEGVIRVDQAQPFHLSVYSADAQRISHITLPDFVKMPHHAVETSAGTYVISYGESGGRNGVCEITRDGNVVSVFDTLLGAVEGIDSNVNKILQRRKFAEKVVCCPNYLAVNEHGEIYATDPVNGGLMVFDSRLKLEAIVKNDLLRKPVSVQCLKSMRGLLIVYGGEEQQTAGIFTHKLT